MPEVVFGEMALLSFKLWLATALAECIKQFKMKATFLKTGFSFHIILLLLSQVVTLFELTFIMTGIFL